MSRDHRSKRSTILAAVLAALLSFLALPASAFAAGNTLYVAAENSSVQGDGSLANPYRGLAQAMQNATDGDTLVLTENVMQRESSAADGFTFDKAVTIKGDSHRLTFRGSDIFFDAPVAFDSITINVFGDGGRANFWAQGHDLTFTKVNTKISDAQDDERPTIYTGGKTSADNSGNGSTITISAGGSEARFAHLILGDQVPGSSAPATVKILGEFTTIDQGITSATTGAVSIESHSRNVTTFTGNEANSNETVIFDSLRSYGISFSNVDNVTLRNNAHISLTGPSDVSSQIPGVVDIPSGSSLAFPEIPFLNIGTLQGEGAVILDVANILYADTVAGPLKIEARAWNDADKADLFEREFFSAGTVIVEPTVVITQNGTETLIPRNNEGKWIGASTPPKPADISGLLAAIDAGDAILLGATISVDGTDVDPADTWTTQEAADAFKEILDGALVAAASGELSAEEVDVITDAVVYATKQFTDTYRNGLKTADQDQPTSDQQQVPQSAVLHEGNKQLPHTGSNTIGVVCVALLFILAGVGLNLQRRNHQ